MELLRLYIHVIDTNELVTQHRTVNMVLFDGTCEGEIFNGTIMQGSVDTQIYEADGRGTLSARYMVKGHDLNHHPCTLFIENNGIIKNGNIVTKPMIYTDSETIKWIEEERLIGKVTMENDQLIVIIERDR